MHQDAHEKIRKEEQCPALPAWVEVEMEQGIDRTPPAKQSEQAVAAPAKSLLQDHPESIAKAELEIDADKPQSGRKRLIAEDILQEEQMGEELRERNHLAEYIIRHPATGEFVDWENGQNDGQVGQAKSAITLDHEAPELMEAPNPVANGLCGHETADHEKHLRRPSILGQPGQQVTEQGS